MGNKTDQIIIPLTGKIDFSEKRKNLATRLVITNSSKQFKIEIQYYHNSKWHCKEGLTVFLKNDFENALQVLNIIESFRTDVKLFSHKNKK